MRVRIESICLNSIMPASSECELCRKRYLETVENGMSCFIPVKLELPVFTRRYQEENHNTKFQGEYLG